MIIRYLEKEEKHLTRTMWEEIFADDSKAFLDYYYNWKTRDNQILVLEKEDERRAMLQLNPYLLHIGETVLPTHYIVGVATGKEFRHRGYMRTLLNRMLRDMYNRKEAFTFLMPAAEAIYKPFAFQFIYDQNRGIRKYNNLDKIHAASVEQKNLRQIEIRAAKECDCQMLAEFSQQMLSQKYHVFAHRDAAYFNILLHEQKSEDGEVMLLTCQGEIIGYFFYGIESKIVVRELVVMERYEKEVLDIIVAYFRQYGMETMEFQGIHNEGIPLENKKTVPIIMARIVHLPQFVKQIKAEQQIDLIIQVQDDILEENNGYFHLRVNEEGGMLQKVKGKQEKLSLSIGELTGIFFGYLDIPELLIGIKPLQPVFLNEIV